MIPADVIAPARDGYRPYRSVAFGRAGHILRIISRRL